MLKLFKYLSKKDVMFIILSIALIVVQVWLELTMPDYTAKLTTAISSKNISFSDVWANGGMMLACAVGSMVSAIICTYFCVKVASNYAKTMRIKLFPHILNFSNKEINKFSVPSLITRTTNDVVQLQMFLSMGMQILIKAPVLAIWAICKISASSFEWTTATIICLVILVSFVVILVALCYPKFKAIQKLTDNLNDSMRENISGVRVVRAFNAENFQANKFNVVNDKVTKNNLFTSRTMGLMFPVLLLLMNLLTLAIYWIGAYLVNDAEILARPEIIGNMTAFIAYALQVIMAFMMLIMIFIILPRTMVSANRIKEVLDTESIICENSNADNVHASEEKGLVEFKNVNFSYDDSDRLVLKDINFTAKSGETIAIIGATGASKTTLIQLLTRFYDVTNGEISIDGVNVKDYKLEELRDKIALSTQKAVLFKGTVRSNLLYGNNQTKRDEDVEKALKIAQAEFVLDNPNGLDMEVAQGGTNFSGGQKQRLAIARTICKNSEIMIFDDSFSALDYKTDMLVRKAIKENIKATIFIIAQRIGTIKNADKIIVLDEGSIVGMGTHEELLKTCEVYKEIALSQLSKEEL